MFLRNSTWHQRSAKHSSMTLVRSRFWGERCVTSQKMAGEETSMTPAGIRKETQAGIYSINLRTFKKVVLHVDKIYNLQQYKNIGTLHSKFEQLW